MGDERGSAKLLRERIGGSGVVSESDLRTIADLADTDRITLARWWWKGQPDPDVITGTFDLPRDMVGDVIGQLLKTETPLELRIFPKGIPWPEDVLVSFSTPAG